MFNKTTLVALAILSACSFVLMFDYSEVNAAAGDAGSSSTGSDRGGLYRTRGGWGWRSYNLGSGQAPEFTVGADWNSIRSACSGYQYVIGFSLGHTLMDGVTPSGHPYVALWDVANINSTATLMNPLYANYKGDSGGSWVPWNSARAMYNALSVAERSGTKWVGTSGGGPVASWFCSEPVGEAEYRANSHITLTRSNFDNGNYFAAGRTITARPGQTVYWRHSVNNYGARAGTFRTALGQRYAPAGTYTHNALSGNRTLNPGATFWSGITSHTIPNDAADGALYCQRYQVDRTSDSVATDLFSAGACVRVQVQWELRGESDLQVNGAAAVTGTVDVKPGDTLYWRHRVFNNGPDTTNRSITSQARGTGFSSPSDFNAHTSSTAARFASGAQVRSFASGYTVTPDDVGRTLCQQVAAWPATQTGPTGLTGSYVCANVPYNFELTPSANIDMSIIVPGTDHQVTSNVHSGPTKSTSEYWVLARVEIEPGTTVPNRGGGTHDQPIQPCAYMRTGVTRGGVPADITCGRVQDGNQAFTAGDNPLPSHTGTASPSLSVGAQVCYFVAVRDRSSSSTQWRTSELTCGVVAHKPKLQVWGGDLRVGGVVDTSTQSGLKSDGATALFGSWVEYGVLSRGLNTGLASKSQFADGLEGGLARDVWSRLTFANTPSYGNYNYVDNTPLAPQFAPTGPTSTAPSNFNLNSAASGTYTAAGPISISGTVQSGRSVIIYAPSQTVTITGDVNYGGAPYSNRGDIPQLVVVADNIHIREGVKTVNGWLLASGVVDTCSDVGTAGVMPLSGVLHSNVCDQQLTVNGPVSAEQLILKRTSGDNVAPENADPAEVFNLRADTYLWQQYRAAQDGQIRVITSRELPARF